MVSLKIIICFAMVCSLALGQEKRFVRHIPMIGPEVLKQIGSENSGLPGLPGSPGPQGSLPSQEPSPDNQPGNQPGVCQDIGGLSNQNVLGSIPGLNLVGSFQDRFIDAIKKTTDENKESVDKGVGAINDHILQNVESAAQLIKTAIDLGFTYPKIFKYFVQGTGNEETSTVAAA